MPPQYQHSENKLPKQQERLPKSAKNGYNFTKNIWESSPFINSIENETMNNSLTILETERLILRRLQPADIPALIDLWCDPDVTQHLGGPRDRDKLETLFAEDVKDPFTDQFDLWPLVKKLSNQVIGHCGLLEKEVDGKDEIEVIYILKASEWGKGYTTEIGKALVDYGFGELKLGRLIALIEPENKASEHVAEKIGMNLDKEVIRPGGATRKVYAIQRS